MMSLDVNAAAVHDRLARELFETCEHLTPIAQDCDACEPLLALGE